jgi:SWI/SNF-related matrix-associated actin-dependent regulator of chromatin subfamily A member 5
VSRTLDRRLKAEVEVSLPPKKEIKVMVHMSEMQRFYYKGLLMKDHTALTGSAAGSYSRLSNLLMQLRKCCNHPFLFPGAEGPNPENTTAADMVAASGKMQTLQMLLKHLIAGGHRVVVFSQFVMMIDVLEVRSALPFDVGSLSYPPPPPLPSPPLLSFFY